MNDTLVRTLALSAAVLACLAVIVVFAERAAIQRTLAEIKQLPERDE